MTRNRGVYVWGVRTSIRLYRQLRIALLKVNSREFVYEVMKSWRRHA